MTENLIQIGEHLRVARDCWLTIDGIVPIEKGLQHRDYFVPAGEKPSKQWGFDLGYVRVSTLGTAGSTLHFEFKELSSETVCLVVGAIERSDATIINLEFHVPKHSLQINLTAAAAISLLRQSEPDFVLTDAGSLFLLQPLTSAAVSWVDENISDECMTFGCAIVVEHRYIGDIVRGAIADGLAVSQ